jgi:hypothetical protein
MNKVIRIVLASTCFFVITGACANKAQNEPQSPALLTPAAGAQPASNTGALPGAAPQGAKVTPVDTLGQPMDAMSAMGGTSSDGGAIPQGSGGASGHGGHSGSGGSK